MKTNNWLVFFAIIAADQASKQIILSRPEWASRIIRNSGLPFVGEAVTGVFVFAAVLLALVLFLISYWLLLDGGQSRAAFALIMGGAISNLIDRIARGAVIDFLDIGLGGKFNLADVAIWVGILFLLYNLFVQTGTVEKQN